MSNTPDIGTKRRPVLEWIVVNVFLFSLAFVLFGPFVLVAAAFLYRQFRQSERYKTRLLVLGGSSVSLGWIFFLLPGFFDTLKYAPESEPFMMLIAFWIFTIPLVPLGALFLEMWEKISDFLKPKSLAEQLEDEEDRLARRERKLSRRARKAGRKEPVLEAEKLRLGPFVKGDSFPSALGLRREARWLVMDERLLDQHVFVLGTTGAGKSETIKRLAYEIFNATDRDLFLVDGKGDEELAGDIRALAWDAGRKETPIFRMGTVRDGAIYDGFRGTAKDIYSRLGAMIGVAEAEGDAQYYADINRDLLQLICYAPSGPPRSFEEVRRRLDTTWLQEAWQDDPSELQTITNLKDRELDGLRRRIRPLVREFAPVVGPEGFALENTRGAVFSIRTQSVSDTASRFLHFLIEDLKDFAGKRQKRPGVLIIDEFGAFDNQNIVALLTLARSAKLGVILATQDVASLGDEAATRLILANTRTKLLMASDFPEEVATLAGTIYQVESSVQHDTGEKTGLGSARIQHAFKIDMNEAARLQPGEGFVIRQRYAAKIRVSAVKEVPEVPEEEPSEPRTVSSFEESKTTPDDQEPPPVIEL